MSQIGTGVVKAGYLIKCAKDSGKNWRKRYFLLNGNTLSYYTHHNEVSKPKGNVLLVGDATVEQQVVKGLQFAFRLTTPFESLLFAALNADERQSWMRAIEAAIELSNRSLRGYMVKRGNALLEGNSRKFFVLHNDILTYHQDHEHTAVDQFNIKITPNTKIEEDEAKFKIRVYEGSKKVTIQFEERNKHEFPTWVEALKAVRDRFLAKQRKEEAYIQEAVEVAVKRGNIQVKATGSDSASKGWGEATLAVTETEVVLKPCDDSSVGEVFKLSPSSTIVFTDKKVTGKDFSFDIITAGEILHLSASSMEEAESWAQTIQQMIPTSKMDTSDVLYREALKRIQYDDFYEVTFTEAKPLGIVLGKVDEWAIVTDFKGYDPKVTGVYPGSVVTSINDELVMFNDYQSTYELLAGWKPPLKLTFRRAPTKAGFLMKRSMNNKRGVTNWKQRYFVLGEGKLAAFANQSMGQDSRVELSLQNASISLIPSSEFSKFYCFKVQSGMSQLVLQAASLPEMLDWAGTIYHAIAMASGGKHIIEYERTRANIEAERQRAMMMAEFGEENFAYVEAVKMAITSESVTDLQAALAQALAANLTGEFIEFATQCLARLEEEASLAEQDAIGLQQTVAPDANQERLAAEAALFDTSFGLTGEDGGNDSDEEEMAGRKSSHMPSAGGGAAYVEEEDDEDAEAQAMAEAEEIKRLRALEEEEANPPATEEDLIKVFSFYVKISDAGERFINVMNFCTIWRMVTGQKGNLMLEMQIFNQFDTLKNGYLTESDFVFGFIQHANEMGTNEYLRKLKFFVKDNNVML